MKKLFIVSSFIIFVIATQAINAQVVIGQPQQNNQQNNGQQVGYQQNNQNVQQTTQYTPEQMKQLMFQQYVNTFFTEATPAWVGSHTTPDTVTSPVSGYKIIRFANGQPVASDYTIPKGSIVARYNDGTTNEYYYSVSEDTYIVKESRYREVEKAAKKQQKKNERASRTPQEKAMRTQQAVMIGQTGLNLFERIFFTIKAAKVYNGSAGYYNTSYQSYGNGGVQTINW